MNKIIIALVLIIIIFTIIFFAFPKSLNPAPQLANNGAEKNMLKITSSAFVNEGTIPKKYTCDGENINPPLLINGVSAEAKSLALIMDDPDAPAGIWTHWVIFNIDAKTTEIKENSVPSGAILGQTSFGKAQYGGPCPPSGTHRYFFKIYSLDEILNIPQGSDRKTLENAMAGHIIEQAEMMGRYSR